VTSNDPTNTPYTRTLQLAAETLGSTERLAEMLRVEHARLSRWMSGAEQPPYDVFSTALDIVATGSSRAQMLANRAQARADRSQERADRDQARADRDQAAADRSSRPATEQFKQVARENSEPASNAPENDSSKNTG
jgi:hypothetical protein